MKSLSHDQESKIPIKLISDLRKGQAVAWIGAGLSIGLGYPSWTKLVNTIADSVIRAIVDAYRKGTITVTVGNENVNANNHIYDLSVIMGMIQNHTYDGLGLPIPKGNKEKGELFYEKVSTV